MNPKVRLILTIVCTTLVSCYLSYLVQSNRSQIRTRGERITDDALFENGFGFTRPGEITPSWKDIVFEQFVRQFVFYGVLAAINFFGEQANNIHPML